MTHNTQHIIHVLGCLQKTYKLQPLFFWLSTFHFIFHFLVFFVFKQQTLYYKIVIRTKTVPVAATQCAQPAAAFTIDASVGSGKGSGVS